MINKNKILIYKELLQCNKKIQQTKCVKGMKRQFKEKGIQIDYKQRKKIISLTKDANEIRI